MMRPTRPPLSSPMSLSISWRLSSAPGALVSGEPTPFAAWVQLAQAAEYAGLDGLFIPATPGHAESFTVAAALCAHTKILALTTSFPSEVMLPAALAAAAHSLQSISHNRLRLHLLDSEHNSVRHVFGDLLNRDQRHERSGEYLSILAHLLDPARGPLDFSGQYFHLENASLPPRQPLPLTLDEAQSPALIAAYADECLLHAQHPQRLGASVQRLSALADQQGRQLTFATALGVIVREHADDAWAAADLWLEQQRHSLTVPSAPADASVLAFAASPARRFEIYPNLWRPSPHLPLLLVGSAEQVAARLEELHGLGIGHVVLEGLPAVQEILRIGEDVLPRLRARGVTTEVNAHGRA